MDSEHPTGSSTPERFELRLAGFGARIVDLAAELTESKRARHIRDQLLRAGTAPGAHYSEARNAQSRADFIHKLGLAAKEAREALYWLRVAARADSLDPVPRDALREANELVAMLYSSVRTARERKESDDG
jgi:four helix bundle protein